MEVDELKKQWHAPFCAAMRLELRANKDILQFINEYNLSFKPLQLDLLIIKKTNGVPIINEIGKIFRGHNIIEYKSPNDSMNVYTYYKVMGYAYFYISLDENKEKISKDDITITLIREEYPRELVNYLKKNGFCISEKYSGISYAEKDGHFPLQIVTSRVLDPELHTWLTALTRRMDSKKAEKLIESMNELQEKGEWNLADAVLELAMNANKKVFQKVKEENPVCKALLELMKPEVDEMLNNNTLETKTEGVERIVEKLGLSLAEACDILKLTVEEYFAIKEKGNALNTDN